MYDDIFIHYSDSTDGLTVYSKPGASAGVKHPELGADGKWKSVSVGLDTNTKITFTGRFFEAQNSGSICFQIIINFLYGENQYGYIWDDELNMFSKTPITTSITNNSKIQNDTEQLIKELIYNNQYILENNLLAARIFEYCRERGVVIPNEKRAQLYALHSRLMLRNEKMKDKRIVESYNESISPTFATYNQSLINWMNGGGIGLVVSTGAMIVIGIIIIAGAFATAYALLKPAHAESKVDFKLSDNLLADLVKYLPPDVYSRLMAENNENESRANQAIKNAKKTANLKMIKNFAIGFAGFWLIDKFLYNREKSRSNG